MDLTSDHQLVLGILATKGVVSSGDLQAATLKSQPTISRLLADLSPQVVTVGRARSTRYVLPKSIHGRPGQQPLWWTDEKGERTQVGSVSFLANESIFVHAPEFGDSVGAGLPWFLSPLKAEGFLGRVAARALTPLGVEDDPEKWALETILYAALQVHDAPGAMTIGVQEDTGAAIKVSEADLLPSLDAAAAAVTTTLPAGSSAGGEQPKFLALMQGVGHVIVKFTPPMASPGGKRWADLLHAEHLAAQTLSDNGVSAAKSRIVRSEQRCYLISERFDRVGWAGRRHVVSIGKAHEAYVHGAYRNWVETTVALATRGCLSSDEANLVAVIRDFGRLIGNTDMHSGNLGLFVSRDGIRRGRFELAPVYDMLPMRWRPDALQGGVQEYTAFAADDGALASNAAPIAVRFWDRLSQAEGVSQQMRAVAGEMSERIREELPADQFTEHPRG